MVGQLLPNKDMIHRLVDHPEPYFARILPADTLFMSTTDTAALEQAPCFHAANNLPGKNCEVTCPLFKRQHVRHSRNMEH